MFSKKKPFAWSYMYHKDVHWVNKYYMYIEFEVKIRAKTICSSRYQYKYMYEV